MCALSSLTLHAARRGHASLRPCVFVPRPWDCRTCWSWACRDNCLSQACLQKAPMARPSAGSCLKHRWSRGKKVRKSTENDEVSERMRAGSQAGRHVFYVVLVFCFAFLCKDQQARVPITSLSLRSSWYRTKLMLMWKLHSRCCCVAHDHAGFGVGERRLCFEFLLQHGPLSPENHLSLSVSLGFVLFLFSSLIDSLPARTLSLSLALSLSLSLPLSVSAPGSHALSLVSH